MRYFPGAARRPLLASALACSVALAVAMPLAQAADEDELRDQQEDVHQQVQQAQQEVEESSRAVTRAAAALEVAEADLSSAREALSTSRSRIAAVRVDLKAARAEDARMQLALDQAQAALAQARADVVAGQAALEAQQETLTESVVASYQEGPPGLLALTGYLQSETPADLTRKMEYSDTLVEDQHLVFDQLYAAEVALRERRAQVRDAEAQVAVQREQAAQQFAATQALRDEAEAAKHEAQVAKDSVAVTVAAREKAKRQAERARQRDQAELARLKRQEQKIKEQILAAAAQDTSTGYVGSDNGFLLAPVSGSVTSGFGYRVHPIYGYWGLHDGTDFGAGCGRPLRASGTGTVISSYYSSVYGNRLHLNVGKVNGRNITVVYNHASSYRVGVGDTVQRGQTVGYVGSTGWSTGCHLHYTVLRDGDAVDPMNYL